MAEEKNINWNAVVTNALSALVETVFVGAAVIVWNAATSIDTKVETATASIIETQVDLKAAQQTASGEISKLKVEISKLQDQIAHLNDSLAGLEIADAPKSALEGVFNPNKAFEIDAKKLEEQKVIDYKNFLDQTQQNKEAIQQTMPKF